MTPRYTRLAMLREAVRQLGRCPGYTGFAIGLLAVGLGTAFAIAVVLQAVLWQPLPVRDPDRLVQISETNTAAGVRETGTSGPTAADWMTQTTSFDGIAAVERLPAGAAIATDADASTIPAAYVTWNFFDVLGAHASLGRTFAQEYDDGLVISHRLWQSHLGGRPGVVGTLLTIDGVRAPVIGVMPKGFALPGRTDVWRSSQAIRPRASGGWRGGGQRDERTIEVIARLKPATTIDRAAVEMRIIAAQIANRFPESNRGWGALVRTLSDVVTAPMKPVLVGVTIACTLLVVVTAARAH